MSKLIYLDNAATTKRQVPGWGKVLPWFCREMPAEILLGVAGFAQ